MRPLLPTLVLLLAGCAAPAAAPLEETPALPNVLMMDTQETFHGANGTIVREIVLTEGHWLCFDAVAAPAEGSLRVEVEVPEYRTVTLLDTASGLAQNETMLPGIPGTYRVLITSQAYTGGFALRVENQLTE